ncbi:MAG: hypothetical protein IJD43_05985 [Thermoguttaceae bacterium]|nr:hypothetical protein [Thermoguttaceae bacterium]
MPDVENTGPLTPRSSQFLMGKTVRIHGPFQSMSLRDVTKLIREHGGQVLSDPPAVSETSAVPQTAALPPVDWVIIGERQNLFTESFSHETPAWLTPQLLEDIECGLTHIATETQLLQRLFPSEDHTKDLTALYTPVMLAELLNVTVADVRRWYQRGLIAPVRVIKKLPYFDLEEVFSARRLSLLLQNGVRPASIEKKLKALRRLNPGVLPLLASNDLVIQGKNVYLRQNAHLLESSGQLLLDFESLEYEQETAREKREALPENLQGIPGRVEDLSFFSSRTALENLGSIFKREMDSSDEDAVSASPASPASSASAAFSDAGWMEDDPETETASGRTVARLRELPQERDWSRSLSFFETHTSPTGDTSSENRISIRQMRNSAFALDEAGKLDEAEEMWRNTLFAAGANAEDAFQLGEILYRKGNLAGARERFSMAIELDEDFVEARADLGCVLGELGEIQLAISALEGAISYHGGYAEAYFHLARFLEIDGQKKMAGKCYRKFLELTDPRDSFWGKEAAKRIQELEEELEEELGEELGEDPKERSEDDF